MTNAIVSNTMIPTAAGDGFATKKSDDLGLDFMNLMQNAKTDDSKNLAATSTNLGQSSTKLESQSSAIKKRDEITSDNESKAVINDYDEASEKVDELAKEVKSVLEDELDVSEEEIEEAMAELGLSYLDLADQNNVNLLVANLTEVENSIDLLMNDALVDVSSKLGEIFSDFENEMNVNISEFQEALYQMTAGNSQIEDVDLSLTDKVLSQEIDVTGLSDEAIVEASLSSEESNILDETVEYTISEEISPEVENDLEVDLQTKENVTSNTKEISAKSVDDDEELETTDNTKTFTYQDKETTTNDGKKQESGDSTDSNRNSKNVFAEEKIYQTNTLNDAKVDFSMQETATVELPTGESVPVSSIMDQIVEASQTTFESGRTTVEILLNPEGLGKVLMEVTEENGQVKAHIYTQNEHVKEALENQMFQLKEQMNQSQTKVTSIEVSVATHEFEQNLEKGQQEREENSANNEKQSKKMRNLNLNNLDELQGLMTQEEELVAKMMRDQGNTLNYLA